VEVDRSGTGLLRVQVDLPQLAQRVGLDEVAFVVHVEPVIDRLTLHIGDESCYVDDCHVLGTLPSPIMDRINLDGPAEGSQP
jgi:hypothetical protein